jgi:hypothetical protein
MCVKLVPVISKIKTQDSKIKTQTHHKEARETVITYKTRGFWEQNKS